jgi:hypothetical protein
MGILLSKLPVQRRKKIMSSLGHYESAVPIKGLCLSNTPCFLFSRASNAVYDSHNSYIVTL